MSTKVILGDISCCRTNHNKMHIEFKCDKSNTRFLDIVLDLEDFAKLITGAYVSDIPMTVSGLDLVGKTRVRESRRVEFPLKTWNRDEQEKWLVDNCQEDGWILDSYLRSQSSHVTLDGKPYLNYSVYKYIDTEE